MATALVGNDDDKDFTTCGVCFEIYNSAERLPKFLSCHHTFCVSCLKQLPLSSLQETGIIVNCPVCRFSTPVSSGIKQLRTNQYALRIIERETLTSGSSGTRRDRPLNNSGRWCYTCDQTASADCSKEHIITTLQSTSPAPEDHKIKEKVQQTLLRLTYDLSHLAEAESYLQNAAQSLEVIQSFIAQSQQQNSADIACVKERIRELQSFDVSHPDTALLDQLTSPVDSSFPREFLEAFEKMKNCQVSFQVETVNDSQGTALRLTEKVQLGLMNPVDGGSVRAACLNTLAFSLAQLLERTIMFRDQPNLETLGSVADPEESSSSVSAASEQAAAVLLSEYFSPTFLERIRRPRLDSGSSFDETVDCELTVTTDFYREFTIIVQVPRLTVQTIESFIEACRSRGYYGFRIVKAKPHSFVTFGTPHNPYRNIRAIQGPILLSQPSIEERGDVGLYWQNTDSSQTWDFVLLLGPFEENNVRRAPRIGRVTRGLEDCDELSTLRIRERDGIRITRTRVYNDDSD